MHSVCGFDWLVRVNASKLHVGLHVLATVPLAWLLFELFQARLGADPVRELTHRSGWWALVFLLGSLCMTPLQRLSGQGAFIRMRRPLGLWCFAFASLHFATFIALDLAFRWSEIIIELTQRPFINIGFIAWLLLVPLALTSNKIMMRKLGRNWQRLHKLAYVIGALACLHFYWGAKSNVAEPLLFAGVFAALMLLRLAQFTPRR